MRNPIILVDFDNTIAFNSYPNIENAIQVPSASSYINRLKDEFNAQIIINTCRHTEKDISDMKWFLDKHRVSFDLINENNKEMIEQFGECRKLFGDVLIDDTAMIDVEWDSIYYFVLEKLRKLGFKSIYDNWEIND